MSRARAEVWESLRDQGRPTTLAALSSTLGLHENTTREHLDALIEAGLATRASAPPAGRGRPAMLYQATEADPFAGAGYSGLATVLADAFDATAGRGRARTVAAGEGWGRQLVQRRRAASGSSRQGARRQIVALFDDLGFTPEADSRAAKVRIVRCPWLEAARLYPQVVCQVHEGMTRGAFAELGGDPDDVRLESFSSPGACELHLLPR